MPHGVEDRELLGAQVVAGKAAERITCPCIEEGWHHWNAGLIAAEEVGQALLQGDFAEVVGGQAGLAKELAIGGELRQLVLEERLARLFVHLLAGHRRREPTGVAVAVQQRELRVFQQGPHPCRVIVDVDGRGLIGSTGLACELLVFQEHWFEARELEGGFDLPAGDGLQVG